MQDFPQVYLDRIQECFPSLVITSLSANRDGLVNDILVVNRELVFRFPKDERAREALAREARLLDLVRSRVELPVPSFEYQETDFVMYRLIPGQALHREDLLRLEDRMQDRLAGQMAAFLQQLHSIPVESIGQNAIPASYAVRSREDWVQLYTDVRNELFPLLMTHAKEWIADHFAPLLDGSLQLEHEPLLIHGDLGPYHILFDRTGPRISGVIDFGTAGLGDPTDDFANLIHGLGESFLRRMIPFYPQIQSSLDRARFHAGTLELQWALNGLRSGDLSWLVCHIGRARDMAPHGAGG